ncbi:MAG: SDR family NAD(P)-dependent oxidoreductase [Pirellulales bacterium]
MPDQRQSAIVTGTASGLGRALALRLAASGWQIALCDVDAEGNAETARLVDAAGGLARIEQLDVALPGDWQALSDRLRGEWPQLDLLVNNAGIGPLGNVGVFPLDQWHKTIDVNLYGTILGCHTLLDWLRANPRGAHIINVASFAAIAPSPAMAAYNVSKAGVVALSETLYGELRTSRVGVTVVCPMHFPSRILAASPHFDQQRFEMMRESTERSTLTAEFVADVALRAMRRKELYAIPGRRARWYWWLRRLTPVRFLNGLAPALERDASGGLSG